MKLRMTLWMTRPWELFFSEIGMFFVSKSNRNPNSGMFKYQPLKLFWRKVGKSKLLLEYVKNNQCDPLSPSISNASGNDYIPTTMEIFRADFQVENEKYSLMILDLSGNQSESVYIDLRSHLYGQFCVW